MLDLKFKPGLVSQLLEEYTCVYTQLLAWKLSTTQRGGRVRDPAQPCGTTQGANGAGGTRERKAGGEVLEEKEQTGT